MTLRYIWEKALEYFTQRPETHDINANRRGEYRRNEIHISEAEYRKMQENCKYKLPLRPTGKSRRPEIER